VGAGLLFFPVTSLAPERASHAAKWHCTWLFGQTRNGGPKQAGAAHGVGVVLVGADLQIGPTAAVEMQREVIRWKDL
jgi:hypothetical protein